MNPTPSEQTPAPARAKWPKRILIAAFCLLLLLGAIGAGAWIYLRSERFNRYVAEQTKAKLREYGIRAEIGGFSVSIDSQTAKLNNIELYNQQTGQPIAKINRAELALGIRDLYALKLSREIAFNTLALSGVELFVDIDEKGKSNFEGLRNAPSTSKALTFETTKLLTTLTGGAIHFKDRSRKIEADLMDLKAEAQPLGASSNIINLICDSTAGRFSYEGREAKVASLHLTSRVSENDIEVESLTLNSDVGDVKAKGKLNDWSALHYSFDVESNLKLGEAMRVVAAEATVKGIVSATAHLEDQKARHLVYGSVQSGEIEFAATKLLDLRASSFNAYIEAGKINFTASGLHAQSVVRDTVKVDQVAIDNLKGSYDKGAMQLTAPAATVAIVELPGGKLSTLTLNNIIADVTETGRFEITSDARLDGGQVDDVKFSNTTAKVSIDNDAVAIDGIRGNLFGGSFTGEFSQPLATNATARFKAAFTDVQTKDASALFEAETLPVAGKVRGEVDLSIAGSNLRSLNGTIATHFEGKASEATDAIPLTGDVSIRVQNGVFNFEQAELTTDASKLIANGKLSHDGDSDLTVSLTSSQAEQLVQLARSFEVARPFIEQYEPQIIGEFKFDGRITGNLESATIDGKVNAATVGLRDAILGALEGRIAVSPTETRVENAVITAQNGGTLKFDLSSPLDKKADTGKLSAVIDRMSLDTILAAVGSPSAEQFISGEVSGEAHITGLPAALEGSAQINLVNGKIADQVAELATAELRFDGKDAILERLEVKLPQSHLVANGSMNLDDYAFLIEGKADQIALDNLAQTFELQNTKIEGSADAEFAVSGKAIVAGKKTDLDWESLKVQLTAQGKNVKVNGRDAGELKLTATTSPGGRIEVELVSGILSASGSAKDQKGKTEVIKASVELRKPGRPIVVESDLVNLDVSPLLSLLAPELASSQTGLTGTITGRLRIEGPSADAQGNATLDLLRGGLKLNETSLLIAENPVKIATPVTIALDRSRLNVPLTHISGAGVELDFGGALGLTGDAPMNFTLNGVINLDRMPSVSPEMFFYGKLSIDARADGSAAEPRLNGKVGIDGFGMSSANQPVFISDGRGSVTLSGDQITLDQFVAKANEGTIEASGVTKLEQFRPTEWRYSIKANNAELIEQNYSATISGNLTLTGTPEGQLLSGTVAIPTAEYQPGIDFDNIATGGGGSLSFGSFGGGPFGGQFGGAQNLNVPPISLNVRVEARDSLIIRNKQINTVGTGSLSLGGKLSDPSINGRITLDGGTLRFRGQRYEITTGALDFPAGGGTPLLNLVAEGEVGGYRVYVGLIGQIDALDTTLRSEPGLSRTEILSLITTGRTEAGTLASQDPLISGVGAAASLLTTGLISKPAEQLLGLSRFQIDPIIRPNSNPAARLTVGQQLSRNIYLSYATNLATERDQTALAEYTLSNRFSALATYTQGGSAARQSVREGVFSLELRGRQRFSLGFKPEPVIPAGDPNEALERIVRPKLPAAQVTVSEVPGLKLNQKKQRELLPVMTQGFSRSLARLGERRLKEFLQESGYFFAEVKSACDPEPCAGENLKVHYEIDSNVIYDLKEIRIEGTDIIKLSGIQEYLQSQPANRLGKNPLLKNLPLVGGYVRGLTSSDRLKNDEEFIRAYLGDIGYRGARVKSRLAVKADSDDLIVIFEVDPGAQSEIAEVAVRGNTILPAPDLLKVVPVQSGEAFSFTRSRAGAQQIKQLYANRGFLEADADLELVERDGDRVKLIYNVNEGARAIVSEIEITGVTKTGKGWIRRYLDFKPGEILTPAKIRKTQRDLYSSNAFREVNLRADPIGGPSSGIDDGSAHRVQLNLTEAKPLLFVYGLGYSTDDGARGLIEVANTNVGGTLNSLSLRLRASRREQFSQLSFTDLRPFGTRLPTTIGVFYNRNSNLLPSVRRKLIDEQGVITQNNTDRTFGLNRFAAFIQTERKLNDRTSFRFRYNLERANLFDLDPNFFPESEVTRNEQSIRLGMFSVGFTRDTRDSVLNPSRGELISADHSLAMSMFGGNESFNKFFGTYQRYRTLDPLTPLLKDSTLAFSARIGLAGVFRDADRNGNGTIDDFERNQQLPISERFFSGGATTLRGFRFETAGPNTILPPKAIELKQSDGKFKKFTILPTLFPVGGNALAVFNFELRYPLTNRLQLAPFYDFGNVFRRVNDFRFDGMTSSVGLGLRINTPLGPVGVDYGVLLDPPAFTLGGVTLRQPRGAFHIRFGQTF